MGAHNASQASFTRNQNDHRPLQGGGTANSRGPDVVSTSDKNKVGSCVVKYVPALGGKDVVHYCTLLSVC